MATLKRELEDESHTTVIYGKEHLSFEEARSRLQKSEGGGEDMGLEVFGTGQVYRMRVKEKEDSND